MRVLPSLTSLKQLRKELKSKEIKVFNDKGIIVYSKGLPALDIKAERPERCTQAPGVTTQLRNIGLLGRYNQVSRGDRGVEKGGKSDGDGNS